MKQISVFGATGSIGQSTLDLVKRDRENFDVLALSGGHNIAQLAQDAISTGAQVAVTAFDEEYPALKEALAGSTVRAAAGHNALLEAADQSADWVMSAIVGAAGLEPGLRAMQAGADLALANKESMVAAGALMRKTSAQNNVTLLPVDSEHSAVFQALMGESRATVERVILTASGGAFRDWSYDDLARATPEQAATHPNWNMGQRITIDSASMFNKSLEIIEAKELFDLNSGQIEVLIHPQSLVHALVGFHDGGLMAHVGPADMRHAIGYALYHPHRKALPIERLNLAEIASLEFSAPDFEKYPALALAYEVLDIGGLSGAVYNAAKEVALDAFIDRKIGFLVMADVVRSVLEAVFGGPNTPLSEPSLENILQMDQIGRLEANIKIQHLV
ncbi:1-deoxy-D-xylulose-5-phosphate reductoisomerase [Paracoccaceae bacterium]|nr:1-deoxy-D-xylulose-5-phosphate reductoisomerase [Paracoccaceae bacterium]MDA9795439.1 1-deoxy-D-xylulose-5-phosphate reductoisomerase [Paracoccaceae bacterium]